ncbi:MAG TPA: histidine phosphatase family protein, partial [Rubricoccaceae bacterium]
MKTILLFRHAKSDWTTEIPDHERPLAERGRKAAVKMGRLVTASGSVPERALVSSAVRTRETVDLAAEAGGWKGPVRATDALYEASAEAVLAELQAEPDDVACVALVGHEPTTSRLAALLVGGGAFEVKTAAVLRIDVPV